MPPSIAQVLLVRARGWLCALPIERVVETFRPLHLEPVSGAPGYVRGLSVVRGRAAPVVDLGALLGGAPLSGRGGRCVTLRTDGGIVVLELEAAVGVRSIDSEHRDAAPGLLRHALTEHLASLQSLDGHLMAVLESSRLIDADLRDSLVRDRT